MFRPNKKNAINAFDSFEFFPVHKVREESTQFEANDTTTYNHWAQRLHWPNFLYELGIAYTKAKAEILKPKGITTELKDYIHLLLTASKKWLYDGISWP